MKIVTCWILSMTALPFGSLLLGGDEFRSGVRAFEDGRYRDAVAAFQAAEQSAGRRASGELHYNLALAALRAGDLSLADAAATRAEESGEAEIAALAGFLRGNTAFQRCTTAALQAAQPESPPFAYDMAIRFGESARDAWKAAAFSRADWPEARRNLERIERFLDALRKQREAANNQDKKKKQPEQREPEDEPPPEDEEEREDAPKPVPRLIPQLVELSPEEVRGLLSKLDEKEREKRKLRRDQRREPGVKVERDW